MNDHEHASLRNLWRSVAVTSIVDAANNVLRSTEPRADAVAGVMEYFHHLDWRLICSMADIAPHPERIERFLLSTNAKRTVKELYEVFGLSEARQRAAAA